MQPLLIAGPLLVELVAAIPSRGSFAHRGHILDSKLKLRSGSMIELSQFNFTPFQLSNMCMECEKEKVEEPMFGCAIKFDFTDPNANTSCHCENTWDWDGVTLAPGTQNGYNTNYFDCKFEGEELFQFKFLNLSSMSSFSLALTHMFLDLKDFASAEKVNLFAEGDLDLLPVETSDISKIYALPAPVSAKIRGVTM